jgi:hypothetical protein
MAGPALVGTDANAIVNDALLTARLPSKYQNNAFALTQVKMPHHF